MRSQIKTFFLFCTRSYSFFTCLHALLHDLLFVKSLTQSSFSNALCFVSLNVWPKSQHVYVTDMLPNVHIFLNILTPNICSWNKCARKMCLHHLLEQIWIWNMFYWYDTTMATKYFSKKSRFYIIAQRSSIFLGFGNLYCPSLSVLA